MCGKRALRLAGRGVLRLGLAFLLGDDIALQAAASLRELPWLQLPFWPTTPDINQPRITAPPVLSQSSPLLTRSIWLFSVLGGDVCGLESSLPLFISVLLSVFRLPPSFLGGFHISSPTLCRP